MTLKSNLTRALGFGPRAPRATAALYARAVAIARAPAWYSAGGVPDTLDGRFEMVALTCALAIARLQATGAAQAEADLTDRFTEDMDAALRESGVGDLAISKQVGHAVGALGGRIGAYRAGLAGDDAALEAVLARNLYSNAAPDPGVIAWAAREVRALWHRLGAVDAAMLVEGRL